MKQTFVNLLKNIFGICLMYAVFIGAVVAVMYILGFAVGGSTGEQMAIWGASIMNTAIRVSALGSVIGMLGFYVEGTHELTMDSNNDEEEESPVST